MSRLGFICRRPAEELAAIKWERAGERLATLRRQRSEAIDTRARFLACADATEEPAAAETLRLLAGLLSLTIHNLSVEIAGEGKS